MGVSPAVFSSAGQSSKHYIPGAYSRRNFVANEGGGVSSGNVCIVGPSDLGEPSKLLVFSSANEARATLYSGTGLDGVVQAFTPGNGITPQEIGFIRVNVGTQSSRTLQNSATDIYDITSYSYGTPMNQMRLKFSAGTTEGYRVQIAYKDSTEDYDNIKRNSFSIQYTGSGGGTAGTMDIDATTLTTTITGDTDANLSLTLADYASIQELVDYLNLTGDYTAEVLTDVPTQLATVLDFQTAANIFTAAYSATSDYQAVYEILDDADLLGAITKSGTTRLVPDADADYIYLTGATAGTSTSSDYTTALAVLENEDIQFISTPSTEAAIHTLIKNHCVSMSSVDYKKERQFYVGGATGETVAEAVARAKVLNSEYGSLCYPGYYAYNDSGVKTLYSPAYYACKQVGMLSALALNNPTTSKTHDIIEWEDDLSRTDKINCIKGGVLCGAKDSDGNYITVRSMTTYQSALLQKNEASIMREALYQSRDLRDRMERALIGTPNLGETQLARVDSIFERTILDWKGLGIIVAKDGELYSGYTRSISGDQVIIQYNTWDTAPTNFVFITHNISVYTSN